MKFLAIVLCLLPSCAVLHHVQISDVDARQKRMKPIDVKVSETGVDIEGATQLAGALSGNKKTQEQMKALNDIISLFQMGPRTGNIVFNDTYAEGLLLQLYDVCPSGRLTGLSSIRESRAYPVISGEIIKITGYCISRRR